MSAAAVKRNSQRRALASLKPAPTHGIHPWLFGAACHLAAHGFGAQEIADVLTPRCVGLRRPVPASEIEEASVNAERVVVGQTATARVPRSYGSSADVTHRWPLFDEERARAAVAHGDAIGGRISKLALNVADAFSALFRPKDLICAGVSLGSAETRPLESWMRDSSLDQIQFVVPSPMSKPEGLTKTGKRSARCLDNTGPRRWIVVEFDEHWTWLEQYDLHVHLGTIAPLGMIVHSRGKSCHGWFFVETYTTAELRDFFGYAVSLGADPSTYTPCQFVRAPAGRRSNNGLKQEILFWSPEVPRRQLNRRNFIPQSAPMPLPPQSPEGAL